MIETIKICSSCSKLKPHGYSNARSSRCQSYCKDCCRLRHIWRQMIQRCTDLFHPKFPDYGGRGIKVCNRWMNFHNWKQDMGERTKGYSLERIDNDGDYTPENCKWASRKEQANNKRISRLITFNNETKTVSQWSNITGIGKNTIINRLNKGWSAEEIFTTPVNSNSRILISEKKKIFSLRRKGLSQEQISEEIGIHQTSVSRILREFNEQAS